MENGWFGELMTSLFEHYLGVFGDENRAAVATATDLNRVLDEMAAMERLAA